MRQQRELQIQVLKEGDRVKVKHEPMFIFLLRDGTYLIVVDCQSLIIAGTVISIRPSPNVDFTSPITERLHMPSSVLRTSEDASILVESLLDLGN